MPADPATTRRDVLNRVPEVALSFWIIKILATTVGETGADFLVTHLAPGLAYSIIGVAFLLALAAQLRAGRYIPSVYWLAVVMVSVVGTLVTDALTDGLGLSLYVSTLAFAAMLAATFAAWFGREHTLSIHSIVTARRERFYWLAILFTFALGTAAGDLMAEQLRLGYAPSLAAFATMIALVAAGYYLFRLNAILAFWIAYVLTRPLGASLGDLLSQARPDGGLGLGTTGTSLAFLVAIAGLVGMLTVMARRRGHAAGPAPG